jgi:hypothetical protein
MLGVYREGSMETTASNLAKYILDLVAIQEIRWNKGKSQPPDDYTFFSMEMEMLIIT